jgi:hypothetical protein
MSIKPTDRGTAEGAGETLTSHATPGFRCDYATGMLANEPRRTPNMFNFCVEERVCYHEAGHAVLSYDLGDGLTLIELSEIITATDSGKLLSVGGLYARRRNVDREIDSGIRRRILDDRVIAYAVGIAAGPAAERKFNIMANEPQHMLGGSAGDHTGISLIRKSLCYDLDPRFDIDIEHEAWRRAQEALELDIIWHAVEKLAAELSERWWPQNDDDDPGEYRSEMRGSRARAILRRCGIRPGMLDGLWPRIEPHAFALAA